MVSRIYEEFLGVHKKLTNTKNKQTSHFLNNISTGMPKIDDKFLVLGINMKTKSRPQRLSLLWQKSHQESVNM